MTQASFRRIALAALTLTMVTASPGVASAWECWTISGCGATCKWAAGSSNTYRVLASDFSSSEQTGIENAANDWDAGSGEILRGANWEYVRGSDVTSWSTSNGRNDVAMEADSWFTGQGLDSGVPALTVRRWFLCSRLEYNTILNDSLTWINDVPSALGSALHSVTQVAMHEFGHAFGFEHEDGVEATMNTTYPGAGDMGDRHRVGEDDFDGLESAKGNSDTGSNLVLSRFRLNSSDEPIEAWTNELGTWDADKDWEAQAGGCVASADRPRNILAHLTGSTSLSSVEVRWTLSSDQVCGDGDDVEIDERSYNFGVNVPYSINPSGAQWCVPSGTASGWYWVCAVIDSTGEKSESSEGDNDLISEKQFRVL